MAYYTNCPSCGKTNVKGKKTKQYVQDLATSGAFLGAAAGSGIFSVPGAIVGAGIGATVGKVVSLVAKKEYEFKCPRCGSNWFEEL